MLTKRRGQCGGIGYNGPTCCQSGWSCSAQNAYYSQCLQGSGGGSPPPPPPPSTTTTTTTTTTKKASSASPTTTTTTTSKASPVGGSSSVVTTTTTSPAGSNSSPAASQGATTAAWYPGNPFSGVNQWANSYYSSEVFTLAIPQLPSNLQAAAAKVAAVPSFQWL
jgi:cellulose 1,4-beta-cellobiosidase